MRFRQFVHQLFRELRTHPEHSRVVARMQRNKTIHSEWNEKNNRFDRRVLATPPGKFGALIRLKPGTTEDQKQKMMDFILARIQLHLPLQKRWGTFVAPYEDHIEILRERAWFVNPRTLGFESRPTGKN